MIHERLGALNVAERIDSGAMGADSRQADFCSYLSAILLGSLL